MGQVEVRGWSFQLSVRNLDLLLQSIQNLENREERTDKTTSRAATLTSDST